MSRLIAGFVFACAASLPVQAQWAPTQAIRIIIPYAPVGTSDIIARTMSERARERLGQPFVIENRPGASTQIGTSLVAKAPPDGHTLLIVANTFAINPSLYGNLPYDSAKDLAPVTYAGVTPHTLLVNPSLPVNNLKELVAYAKARPGQLSYGSVGNGTSFHLGMEELKKRNGLFIVHIPYKGMGQVLNDLLGAQVQVAFANTPNAVPLVEAGRLRAIGMAHPARMAQLPNVPTLAEQGMPGFQSNSWFVFFAPGATPPAILDRLNEALVGILREPAVSATLTRQGVEIMATSRAQTAAFVASETAKYAELVKFSGAKPD
jgi:tripartite-type tricarboxylate transporter receptor subunit TctC